MDWHEFWQFLMSPNVMYLYLLLLLGGWELLSFLRKLYEARQNRLTAEANARVRVAELELEKERERNRPKFNHPLDDLPQDQPYRPYQEGLRQQELPPQQ
jgi:hypothetical protein